jgi:hypothetical protein
MSSLPRSCMKMFRRNSEASWADTIAEKEGQEQRNSTAALKLSFVICQVPLHVIWTEKGCGDLNDCSYYKTVYLGCGGKNPYILNLNIRWRWMVNFVLWLLYPWDRVLGIHFKEDWIGPKATVWTLWQREKSLHLLEIEPRPYSPQSVILLIELSWYIIAV